MRFPLLIALLALPIASAVAADPEPLTIVRPNGGERFEPGDDVAIEWRSAAEVVRLSYSTDAGATWTPITERASGGSYLWKVPSASTGDALVRAERWRPESVSAMRDLPDVQGLVAAALYTPDARRVVIAETQPGHPTDSELHIWDASTLQRVGRRVLRARTIVDVDVAPDNRRIFVSTLAASALDTSVSVIDAETSAVVGSMAGHAGGVVGVDVSQNGLLAVTGGYDRVVKIWDASSLMPLETIEGFAGAVSQVVFDPTLTWLATGTGTSEGIRIFEVASWQQRHLLASDSLSNAYGPISGLEFTRDGTRLLAVTANAGVVIFDVETGRELLRRRVSPGTSLASMRVDGRYVASGRDTVFVWDAATGSTTLVLPRIVRVMSRLTFSPNGGELLTTSRDSVPRIWVLSGPTVETDVSDRSFGIGAPAAVTVDDRSPGAPVVTRRGNLLDVRISAPVGRPVDLVVVDQLGRSVLRERAVGSGTATTLTLDVSSLPSGSYVVSVRCNGLLGSATVRVTR